MRCFIGGPIPNLWREQLQQMTLQWRAQFKTCLTWTKPETWHVTLQFIGEVDAVLVPQISEVLQSVAMPACVLQPGEGGYFPNIRRPRVAWVGFRQGAEVLSRSAAALQAGLRSLGLQLETRPFIPHATLFRVKDPSPRRDDPWSEFLSALKTIDWMPLPMQRIVLWRSDLESTGARHTELASVALG